MQSNFDFDASGDSDLTRGTGGSDAAIRRSLMLDEALDAAADGAVIVTVNQRLSRHLSEAFVRRRVTAGDTWWETPSILPIGNWLETLHDAALACGASGRARLASLVARRRWRAIIAERQPGLLDTDAAAREALRAWRLAHAWHCLPDADAYLSRDAHAWRGWADAYETSLSDDQRIDDATLSAHLIELLGSSAFALPSTVVLAGFLQMTPELRALSDALSSAGVHVAMIGDECRDATVECTTWADEATELRVVADAVYQELEMNPDAVLGIVVPDLESRRGEVRRAFDRRFFAGCTPDEIEHIGRPYDVSVGEPLSDTAVVRTALLVLRLAWRGLDRQALSTLLLSPHIEAYDAEARMRERLERKLRDWHVRRLRLSAFRRRLGEDSALHDPLTTLGKRIGAERREGREPATLGEWADRFSAALAAFGWPGSRRGSEEEQAVQALHGVLDDLQSLDDGAIVEADAALADLQGLARERSFQPETPTLPVRIMGRLESHGQRFDALWVIGLDSDRWPASVSPTPFLSVAGQREAGLPEASAEARLALAQRELDQWRQSAPVIALSCARERDDQPLVPSSALVQPVPRDIDAESMIDPAASVRDATTLERIDDALAPAVSPGTVLRGGATLFRDQAECPFRAFARHRLGVGTLEEVDIGLDARRVGTLLHRALELFWQQTVDHASLMALGATELDERIMASVDTAFDTDEYLDAAIGALERQRVAALLREWIEGQEMNRVPFTVVAFEQRVEHVHGGIALNLTIDRIDRIDTDAGQRRVVLDYKSGRNDSIGRWAEHRIGNPQLPLYVLANDDIEGVAFARVARGACGFMGLAVEEELLPGVATTVPDDDSPQNWDEWRAHWRTTLDTIATEVADGVASVTPTPDACRFCDLKPLCRVGDTLAGDELPPSAAPEAST